MQWRQLGGDIDTLGPQLVGLLPLLYRNLEADRVDDPDIPRLKGVYRHTWVLNRQLVRRLEPAIASLGRNGIPAVMLGGPAVGAVHYRDGGVRRLDDAGVLVPPAEAERAAALLQADHWSVLGSADPRRMRGRTAMALVEPGGAQLRLQWRAFPESAGDEDVWSGAVAATLGRTGTLVPGPTEQLLYACASAARAGSRSLMWIADAAVILRSAEREIEWGHLVNGATRCGLPRTIAAALAVLGELVDASIPDEALAELGASPVGMRQRLLLRVSPARGPLTHYVQRHRRSRG